MKLARGGPDEAKGVLLGAKDEYLILFANDGTLIHYPVHHLKSVTELMDAGDFVQQVPFDLLDHLPSTFPELMKALRGRKIKVYDHGPEAATGFLFDCGEDFIKMDVPADHPASCIGTRRFTFLHNYGKMWMDTSRLIDRVLTRWMARSGALPLCGETGAGIPTSQGGYELTFGRDMV